MPWRASDHALYSDLGDRSSRTVSAEIVHNICALEYVFGSGHGQGRNEGH
jgi:hypothetical protein